MKMTYSGTYDSSCALLMNKGYPFFIYVAAYHYIKEMYHSVVPDIKMIANHSTVAVWKVTPKQKPQN